MDFIPLENTPNQEFPITLDNNLYTLGFRTIGDLTYMDLDINGTVVISGMRCPPNQPLIPYQYLEGSGGNFIFVTQLGAYPNFTEFGITQNLVYASAAELAALRAVA